MKQNRWIAGLAALTSSAVLAGCVSPTPVPQRPDPTSDAVVAARADAASNVEEELQALLSAESLTSTVDSRARHDLCYVGGSDIKVKRDYEYRCTQRLSGFAGSVLGAADALPALGEQLASLGWTPQSRSLAEMSSEYEPAVDSVTCLPGVRYLKGNLLLDVSATTAGRGGSTCWSEGELLISGVTLDRFYQERDVDVVPNWGDMGNPALAVALSVETNYVNVR